MRMYTTYVSQKTVPFLRMQANSFSFVFHDFHSVLPMFLLTHLCSAQPSSLNALPTTSTQTDPLYRTPAPVVSAKPPSPCDTCCVGWPLADGVFSASSPETDHQVDAYFSASLHCP